VAIRGVDLVLVASIPDYLSTYGLDAFVQTFWTRGEADVALSPRRPPHVLVTRLQRQVRQHQHILARLEAEARAGDAGFRLLATRIPQSASLAEALMPCAVPPTFTGKYGSHVSATLVPLIGEVKEIFRAA
jgi:cellulose biosynthesis protein BcsQ